MDHRTRLAVRVAGALAGMAIAMMGAVAANDEGGAPDRRIFILAGQSNASGRGALAEVPPFAHADRIWVYSNAGRWVPGREPVDDAAGQVDRVSLDQNARAGPGMAFADRLAQRHPCLEIGLVPAARGGVGIDAWTPNLSRGTLYGSMVARAREASQAGRIAGLIWYQGETDSNDPALTAAWPVKFEAIVNGLRSDLAIPDLPVIMTVLGPKRSERYTGWDAFVAMQTAAKLPAKVVRVSAGDLEGIPEDPHLTTADYVELGHRYADAMSAMMEADCRT